MSMIRNAAASFVAFAILTSGFSGFIKTGVSASTLPQKSADEKPFRSNGLIIKPKAGVSQKMLRSLHASRGVTVKARFVDLEGIEVLDLPEGMDVQKALELYSNDPLIEYAEPDYLVSINQRTRDDETDPNAGRGRPNPGDVSASAATLPTNFPVSQWGLHNTGQTGGKADADIDAPEAWGVINDASSVIVAVVDTGVDYTHPDLAGNMWRNPREIAGNGKDDDGNGYIDDVYGIDTLNNTGDPRDSQYHGTHVAGTIGAVGNNGVGAVGVAWSVKLMALKFISAAGWGGVSDAITCIDYARKMGAKVINASWGGPGYSQALFDAVSAANKAGIVFVAAAGNDSSDNDSNDDYPSNFALPNVITVASSDANDLRSYFSNYGYRNVKVAAPGSGIYSTMPGNSYGTLSGTSMAAPHVSGALALLRAYRPELSTPAQLIDRIAQSSDALPAFESNTFSGGRLNIYNALTGKIRPVLHLYPNKPSDEPGTVITFTDDSIGVSGNRRIDFGDGSPVQSFSGSTSHLYPVIGNYTVTLTASSGSVTYARSIQVALRPNYDVSSDAFAWIDTSGFASLNLKDNSVSDPVDIPFVFPFYGRQYWKIHIGSNGAMTFGTPVGANYYANRAIPSFYQPNAAIYAYWDDLNPEAGGTIRYGNSPEGFVISYEGISPKGDVQSPLTFQVILKSSGVVKIQYLDVKSTTAFGGGKSATVGIEDEVGGVGRQYSYLGSPLLMNNMAIKFVMNTAQVPTAPSGLTATAPIATQVNLAWNDNSNNESGFEIESSLDNLNFMKIATTGPSVKSYTLTGLSGGTTYYYRVRALNTYGVSAYAVASVRTPTVPTTPATLTASVVSNSQIDLRWVDKSNDETGFKIERSTNGSTFTQIATVNSGVYSYSVTGLSLGTLYYFRVRAYNTAGDSLYSNTANATTLSLLAPTGLAGTALSKTSIALSWTDTNSAELGYRIERHNGNTWVEIATVGANKTAFTDTGLSVSTSYVYRVRAYNIGGTSAYSSAMTAKTLP